MGHKHTKAELLSYALDEVFDHGLSQLTFGRLARRLGVSDRIVVYYFPTKDVLITEVLLGVGARLQQVLGEAFVEPAADHRGLARAAWPVLARAEVDPLFAVFFEANGLAAARRTPYREVLGQLVEAWISWLGPLLDGPPARQRAEAAATIALVDGLLLLRQLAGPDAAEQAAASLGLTGSSSPMQSSRLVRDATDPAAVTLGLT
jgi:AcrR family transcriptional regulator